MDTRVKPAYDAACVGGVSLDFLIYNFKQPRARVLAPRREVSF